SAVTAPLAISTSHTHSGVRAGPRAIRRHAAAAASEALVVRPLGFTIELTNRTIGVTAANRPTSDEVDPSHNAPTAATMNARHSSAERNRAVHSALDAPDETLIASAGSR